jgi:hypothetical protein
MKTISFQELRKIKDELPSGSTARIARELGIPVETVRNYFGGVNESTGNSGGIHIEPGPEGGLVIFDDDAILDKALVILGEIRHNISSINSNV